MTLHMPAPLHLPAEPFALSSARRVRVALVVRCGRTPTRATLPIVYVEDEASAAWYAELRAKQAVR